MLVRTWHSSFLYQKKKKKIVAIAASKCVSCKIHFIIGPPLPKRPGSAGFLCAPALTGALRHRSKIGFQISNPAHAMPCAILTDPLRQIVTPCWHSCHFIQPYVFFICTCVTRVVSCNIVRASRPMPGLCLCRNTTRGFFVFLLFQKGVLTTWPHKTQFCMQKSASKQDCPFQQVPYVQLF